ncbi:hypothetical protein POTOM_033811 [Populus tomentosa]|uniref:Reverse transcriptase zinc-binding domain-containing protein n=1 Tax=Populus tomentosa TaxID=118781 RepID=A0A8X7Z645_POPTO|nr:hypothetical protein POTOM_033811 [Populus tomentosa]
MGPRSEEARATLTRSASSTFVIENCSEGRNNVACREWKESPLLELKDVYGAPSHHTTHELSEAEGNATVADMVRDATSRSPVEPIWRLIWRWKGPERIRNFLWLVAHNKLPTNNQRVARHLTDNACCHLNLPFKIGGFLVRALSLILARCMVSGSVSATKDEEKVLLQNKNVRLIGWRCTPSPRLGENKCAWMGAAKEIVAMQQLWAAITGLQLAWSLKILLESDSCLVLDMITKQDSTVDTSYALVSRVKDALTWGWAVTVPHALGEGNFAAEWLVNLGPGRNPLYRDGWRINDPPTVFYLTLYDHLIRS